MTLHPNRIWCVDSPGLGGAELALLRVLRMTRVEQNYVLHAVRASPEFLKSLKESNIGARSLFPGCNTMRSAFAGLKKAFCCARVFPNRLFLVWCHHLDSNRWLQLGLALRGVQFIVVERAVPATADGFVRSRLTVPIKRFVSRHAHLTIVNGRSQVHHYAQLLAIASTRVGAIPNSRPIEATKVRAASLRRDRQDLRNSLGLPQHAQIIVSVGRLSVEKGQSSLLCAMQSLNAKHPNAQLLLVGDGEHRRNLERQARDLPGAPVWFAGHQRDVLPFLAAADLFVLPSPSEGLPGALIEAMAAGLPCIATDIPGNRELVQHEKTGLSVPTQDASALEKGISQMLENPHKARQLAEAGYRHVLQNYDEADEARLWRSLLGEVAESTATA